MIRRLLTVLMLGALAGCSFVPPSADRNADVIVIGDSILAWHRATGRSIPAVVADVTGLSVSNVAVSGAKFIDIPNPIPSQYVVDDWDWVIVDGGGNDLLPVCGTPNEGQVLNALVTADGAGGAIPIFVNSVATSDTKVIVLGYYPVSEQGGPFVPCRSVLDRLAARQAVMAAQNPNVIFVDAGQVIGAADRDAYAGDLVHPSPRGAALVGQLIASVMVRNGG